MSSLTKSCEIVEESEESTIGQKPFAEYQLNSGLRTGEHNGKLPVLKVGYKESLEDDINKLFEAISLKRPSKGSDKSEIGMSPKMKNVMKKAIAVGVPGSPRIGNSEPVNMKQALRDLCISKASEMAAMKRLLKSSYAPATSEAGRIKTLYNAVVGEASGSGTSLIEDKDSIVGISLVPEETKSPYSTSLSSLKQPKMTSSQNTNYSPEVSCSIIESESGSSSLQKETSKIDLVHVEKNPSVPALSHSNSYATLLELAENILISSKPTSKTSTQKAARRGGMETTSSTSSSTSLIGKRVSKPRNAPRAVEQVLRNNTLNKKKTKPDSGSTVSSANNITGCNSEPGTSQLVCERCRCALKNMKTEENHDSVTSKHKSSKNGVSLSNVQSAASKLVVTSTTCNRSRAVGKVNNITKLTEIGEISQSSKSSQGDHSSSTSTSDDSNASGSSCGNRPHMSKDSRWEAIRQVQTQYGVLGLKHFNLLKKLGSGDIGTVYLAELIGTNCLFAIKVMDNEFLVRRKKMPRAQTEREILRILDHPFLPTLYAQFTSDNLSCLVMEYCPGGDLHVLRQRQLGRSFSEAAARFYVAEILLALEYLHMLGVVYRDLKPENILVREKPLQNRRDRERESMGLGLKHFSNRTGDGAGGPFLDADNGEELMHVQPGVAVSLGNHQPESPGTLYISSKQVIWLSDVERTKGYAVDFLSISLHAVSRDPDAYPSPCIYAQIETEGGDDESEDSDSECNDNLDLSRVTEMRLIPSDPGQLDTLFDMFCQCAELNPEPIDEEVEEHHWVFSADQIEDVEADNEDYISHNPHNLIGHSNGDHTALELQINDLRFEDADEVDHDKDSPLH